MILYPRNLVSNPNGLPVVRLIGVGNAGCHIADGVACSMPGMMDVVAIDSDRSTRPGSPAVRCVELGPLTTHGIGAGGDPELALEAARESRGELQKCLEGADIIILCGGLGGGTASATLPFLAELARSPGVMVAAVVTTPFSFEGRRRSLQAAEALKALETNADAVVHFENDRMADLVKPLNHVRETFAECDRILLEAISSLAGLVRCTSPLPVSRNDLLGVLRAATGSFLFGSCRATGDQRAARAAGGALSSPLLDQGRLLREAAKILVHITGPENLRFDEVAAAMQTISGMAAESHSAPRGGVGLQRVGFLRHCPRTVRGSRTHRPRADPPPPPKTEQPAPVFTLSSEPAKTSPAKPKQEDLPLDPVTRGPFDHSEPTLFGKEDLDIPTFIRLKTRK